MSRRDPQTDTQGVTVELLSRHLVRTVDAIGLPGEPLPVEGRASREDAYTIHVTASLADTAERLTELIGGAKVAIVTDSTVMDLYGPTLVRALHRAGIEPEIAAIPPGEQHKTLGQACKLLDWLTGTQDAAYVTGAVLRVDGGLLSG
jgi:3-dehydroquinate synthetase